MATEFINTDSFGTGIRLWRTGNDTDVVIDREVLLGSSNDVALKLQGLFHDVILLGTVSGSGNGIELGADSSTGNRNTLHEAEDGLVRGQLSGVAFYGTGSVVNNGTILGNDYGITFSAFGASYSISVTNRGLIQGGKDGVWVHSGDRIARLVNEGTIEGIENSYRGFENPDFVVNRGIMRGSVQLHDNTDRYDGRRGIVEGGAIFGGGGDDTFLPGMGEEAFYGGEGRDTLDFLGSAGVTLSLVDDFGTGAASGNIYSGIEQVLGSRWGSDAMTGDAAANTFVGFGGADTLSGMVGDDWLRGGKGADRLWGGGGNDRFRFHTPEERGDIISDWGNRTGNSDVIEIAAMNFGVESTRTLAASRFQIRADNLAQDSGDRFIFRTTDTTLWFDTDGKGGAAAVLLADVQPGVVLSAADFVVV